MHRGWLNKQGGHQGGFKNWKRRWFVLTTESLDYYRTEEAEGRACLGSIDIPGSEFRVFSESEDPPEWENKTECHLCGAAFNLTTRRHHCRRCGWSLCGAHSRWTVELPKLSLFSASRVCKRCYDEASCELEAACVSTRASGGGPPVTRKFTLPTTHKPNLFVVRSAQRELWLHAETGFELKAWTRALRAALDAEASAAANSAGKHPQWSINFTEISESQKVADGAFGEVFRARLWGTDVAVKKIKGFAPAVRASQKKQNPRQSTSVSAPSAAGSAKTSSERARLNQLMKVKLLLADLRKEINILSQLRHPNVVLYIGACTRLPDVCIVTEWCHRGSLYQLLHQSSARVDTARILDLSTGIAQGVNYLHSLDFKVVHRDLKSHNVLVDAHFVPKVADFGLSHVWTRARDGGGDEREAYVDGMFGTVEWMAPEIMDGERYNQTVDVYSFGIVMSELVSRRVPFRSQLAPSATPADVIELVLERGAAPRIPAWCNTFFGPLIRECIDRNPARRPSFARIVSMLRACKLREHLHTYCFDVPRLVEFLRAPDPTLQALAADELADLCNSGRLTRGATHQTKARASWDCVSRHFGDEKTTHELDNGTTHALLRRLAALLQSPRQSVLLASLDAIRSVLRASGRDLSTAQRDAAALPSRVAANLARLMQSRNDGVRRRAGMLLLALAEAHSSRFTPHLVAMDVHGREQLSELLSAEVQRLRARAEAATRLARGKADLLARVRQEAPLQRPGVAMTSTAVISPPPLPDSQGETREKVLHVSKPPLPRPRKEGKVASIRQMFDSLSTESTSPKVAQSDGESRVRKRRTRHVARGNKPVGR